MCILITGGAVMFHLRYHDVPLAIFAKQRQDQNTMESELIY